MILTHPLPVPIEITSAGVTQSSHSEGGQDLRLSLRVVADHGVESPVWCRQVPASSYDEGVNMTSHIRLDTEKTVVTH